ncbi:hypothetical protein DRO19_00050 [Candidatus Bathyarchaeota archaeon]|nr:MAG: hypothetical protein DRO19_00050 [Candidatus Bathyarchaeota archaeon]
MKDRHFRRVMYSLNLIIKNLEEGNISPSEPTSMEWLCQEMMEVIEGLEKMTENEVTSEKLVEIYGEFERLKKIFEILAKRKREAEK